MRRSQELRGIIVLCFISVSSQVNPRLLRSERSREAPFPQCNDTISLLLFATASARKHEKYPGAVVFLAVFVINS